MSKEKEMKKGWPANDAENAANEQNDAVLRDAYADVSHVVPKEQDPQGTQGNRFIQDKSLYPEGQTHLESTNRTFVASQNNRQNAHDRGEFPISDIDHDTQETFWWAANTEANDQNELERPLPNLNDFDGKKAMVAWQNSPVKVNTGDPDRALPIVYSDFKQLPVSLGKVPAFKLSRNLYGFLPHDSKLAAQQWHEYQKDIGTADPAKPETWHHAQLNGIIDYMQAAPEEQQEFFHLTGNDPEQFHRNMEEGHKHLQYAANMATNNWLTRDLHKTEVEQINNLMKWEPTPEDYKKAFIMASSGLILSPEFNSAKFMANNYIPTEEDIINATIDYEGDYVAIALAAHRIEVNESNRDILAKLLQIQSFGKSEMNVSSIPRIVKPVFSEYKKVSTAIQKAFKDNKVYPVELDGKHCKGSALMKDTVTNTIWFLKPGSGKPSKAWGVTEEAASASRREVAFNEAAKLFGLSRYIPKSALITLDGQEVAAIEFFTGNFKSIEEIRKDKTVDLRNEFSKYVNNGLLYKWAILDFVLGNPDRHGGNIMIDEYGNLKLIDAGSAFAGPSFNPAKDPKSWVPFYLRVFSARKWKELTPESKMDVLPTLSHEVEDSLAHWLYLVDETKLVELLNKFQINPGPVLDRLLEVKNYSGPKSEFIRKFFTNNLVLGSKQ
jgi:hypothetical protein